MDNKDFSRRVKLASEVSGVKLSDARIILSGYYREARRLFKEVNHTHIRLRGLGVFYIVKKRVLPQLAFFKNIENSLGVKRKYDSNPSVISRHELIKSRIKSLSKSYEALLEQGRIKDKYMKFRHE